jgi:hypothetical protein
MAEWRSTRRLGPANRHGAILPWPAAPAGVVTLLAIGARAGTRVMAKHHSTAA